MKAQVVVVVIVQDKIIRFQCLTNIINTIVVHFDLFILPFEFLNTKQEVLIERTTWVGIVCSIKPTHTQIHSFTRRKVGKNLKRNSAPYSCRFFFIYSSYK